MTSPATTPSTASAGTPSGAPTSRARTALRTGAVGALLLVLAACGSAPSGSDRQAGSGDAASPSASASPSADGCVYTRSSQPQARRAELPAQGAPKDLPAAVVVATNRGDVRITLADDQAPCAVNSLVSLAGQRYFDDTPCHRLVTRGIQVLQCGDPSGTGRGGPGYVFADELVPEDERLQPCRVDPSAGEVCTYPAGTVAMANAGPDTNGSQFFLVYGDSPLPNSYTVLGTMDAAGLKVVRAVARGGNAADGVAPREPVTIRSVRPVG